MPDNNHSVILVDGNGVAIAGWWVYREMVRSDGVSNGLVYACLRTFSSLLAAYPAAAQVWCWDCPPPCWRKRSFPEYKSNRTPWSEEQRAAFSAQSRVIRRVLDLLGAFSVSVPGVEADDLIGILSKEARSRRFFVFIRSADQDFYQLLEPGVVILKDSVKMVSAEDVEKKYGVPARSWRVYRALVGDSSDNLKGMLGVGPVRARRMLAQGFGEDDIHTGGRAMDPVRKAYEIGEILRDKGDERVGSAMRSVAEMVNQFLLGPRRVSTYEAFRMIGEWEVPDVVEELWGVIPIGG